MDKKDLLKSKHFCIQPFVHSCIWTDGRIIPCCINQDYVLGNAKTDSLYDVYSNNNQKLVDLRKEMLEGPDLPKSCYRCGDMEKEYADNSYRYYVNKHYGHLLDNIEINNDGTINDIKISTWDVRFSNLCNLKCRTCDSVNSSKIAEEEKKHIDKDIVVLKEAFDNSDEFFKFFEENIDVIEEIYFCGGEPLFLKEHYTILDLLAKHEKFDTVLRYNTNCTKLSFRDKNVVDDYWIKFKKIRLSISLDAGWEQLHYIRHGAKWESILSNLKYIVEKCPHIYMQLCPTIGILNAFHVKRLHMFLVQENILKLNDVYFNILTFPNFYSITALPSKLKEELKTHWEEYKKEIVSMGSNHHMESEIDKVIRYMYTKDQTSVLPDLIKETKFKDTIRKESFKNIFPELRSLYE